MDASRIVDVDDRTTWPSRVAEIVNDWAARLRGTTEYTGDLDVHPDHDEEFRKLFAGLVLRAYHCTRLLPLEVWAIREFGLRPLSADLVRDRIALAESSAAISRDFADELRGCHVFATNEARNRQGQVCLILSRQVFQDSISGCIPLLSTWGGEALYKSSRAERLRPRLCTIGAPAIVVALLDFNLESARHLVFPEMQKIFVAAALGLRPRHADVLFRAPVLPMYIENVLRPCDRAYARLGNLPR